MVISSAYSSLVSVGCGSCSSAERVISSRADRSTALKVATLLSTGDSGVLGSLDTDSTIGTDLRIPIGMLFGDVHGLRKFDKGVLRTSLVGKPRFTDSMVAKQRLKSMMDPCWVIHFDPITISASHSEVMLNLIGKGSKVGEICICASTYCVI